jgi:PAS domain S-box-containing protein
MNGTVILNVDDNEAARYAKTRSLERGGYTVIEARTGAEAMERTKKDHPDLVLLDVRLPDISGYEVCRILKATQPQLLVLQVSASFVEPGDRAHGLDSGADAYLTQPLETTELLATIRALLRLRTAEQAARESGELYKAIVESASDYAIITTDLDGTIRTWSSGAERVLGHSAAEMVGRSIDTLFTPEDLAAGVPAADRERAAREERAIGERWQVRKDGDRLWATGIIVPLRDAAANATGFIVILRDQTAEKAHQDWLEREVRQRTRALTEANEKLKREIEERERAEEALRQAQKMEALGQLTGGIAHDFNNMLTVVMGSAETLKRRLPPEAADQHRRADLVLQAGAQAAALTHRLLAFSRQQPRDPKPTSINASVTGIMELIKSTVGESIALGIELSEGLPPVLIDGNQLENAILNLVVNARDAMPNGGTLTIRTGSADEERSVLLSVVDTGAGMPPEVAAKAFEPFFTTKRLGQGTGLGLAQVQRCVEQAGGEVRIDSGIGKGTAVVMTFPSMLESVRVAEAAVTTRTGEFHGKGRLAMVVEDEPGVRDYVVESLRGLGFEVMPVGDAVEALERLAAGRKVDLVISDVGLPGGVDGWQFAARARLLLPDVKIVLMTGYAQSSATTLGAATELLMKPFTVAALETRLHRLFGE